MRYFKVYPFIQNFFPAYVWQIPTTKKEIYLTFDDGPTPEITKFVLNLLKQHDAKATFFCIGENIQKHPDIFKEIIKNEHSIGNHTQNHCNGWKTKTKDYIKNVLLCETEIEQNSLKGKQKLFRPPYGKINPWQALKLRVLGYKIIMWNVVSYDFDVTLTKEKCLENVIKNCRQGSIIVFHDSVKSFKNLEYVLPKTLQFLKENNYDLKAL